jgi:hypothetical protein
MFLYNLQAILVGIALFSLPALLLELQLLVIGLNGMSPIIMVVTLAIGIVSAIGAVLIEIVEG